MAVGRGGRRRAVRGAIREHREPPTVAMPAASSCAGDERREWRVWGKCCRAIAGKFANRSQPHFGFVNLFENLCPPGRWKVYHNRDHPTGTIPIPTPGLCCFSCAASQRPGRRARSGRITLLGTGMASLRQKPICRDLRRKPGDRTDALTRRERVVRSPDVREATEILGQ